ncbi:MAG TPA: acyltransferase, partial [Stellaceae bacterium]|nr:acyltransferase [Stellaceae bacterium]
LHDDCLRSSEQWKSGSRLAPGRQRNLSIFALSKPLPYACGPAGGGERRPARCGASLALGNLRGLVILLVLSFHSVLAYLRFLPAAPFRFDSPPYQWSAFPIVDRRRWLGFDLFCAWQDVFLMTLYFFLSGLFVWPSLERKGAGRFLYERALRLGLPFAAVALFLMPVTLYPTYRQTAADPRLSAYWRQWRALPFWPCGPMWFLWLLLAGDGAAAALHRLVPRRSEALIRAFAAAGEPRTRLAALLAASALAYGPLALAFGPMRWSSHGPFSFQLSRPLHYAVYFFAGIALGARGVEGGLFAPDGPLARRWRRWLAAALASFALWIALTALTREGKPPLGLRLAADLSFVLACFANCFGVLALALRFARRRSRLCASLRDNAYGMYLVHYVFVVWLQYALRKAALPAVVKAALVFAGTLLASWGASAALRSVPAAAQILGPRRARVAAVPS